MKRNTKKRQGNRKPTKQGGGQNSGKTQQLDQHVAKRTVSLTDKWLRGLSLAGVMLTMYLTWVAWQGSGAAFCETGGGCDVIQSSQWSRFLGIPLAVWGLGLYALLAIASFGTNGKMKRWKRLWRLSFLGVVISVYLTATGLIALGSLCAWCLTSFALLVAIFILAEKSKPQQALGNKVTSWYVGHLAAALGMVALMFVSGSNLLSQRGDPRLHELAEHLTETEAVFYGAYWCSSCAEQKRLFSGAADKLPYVECSPGGPNSPMTSECVRAGVSGFPTWEINGRVVHVGVLTPQTLADMSGYKWNKDEDE